MPSEGGRALHVGDLRASSPPMPSRREIFVDIPGGRGLGSPLNLFGPGASYPARLRLARSAVCSPVWIRHESRPPAQQVPAALNPDSFGSMVMEEATKNRGATIPLAAIDPTALQPGSQPPRLLPAARKYKALRVVLIKPSKDDDEGYVVRFWKGVLPSNTLSVLRGLTDDVRARGILGDIQIRVDTFDETTEKVPV